MCETLGDSGERLELDVDTAPVMATCQEVRLHVTPSLVPLRRALFPTPQADLGFERSKSGSQSWANTHHSC